MTLKTFINRCRTEDDENSKSEKLKDRLRRDVRYVSGFTFPILLCWLIYLLQHSQNNKINIVEVYLRIKLVDTGSN